ncbi:hypothetical protein DPMN_059419 [Dreissena polymorpha]|uniref:Uncharacterized protein n=1 Tax=Dreissena polymorpha TaxID=45954 RepID=A0A9D4C3G7_DREPO|nr:hypothetical protein DPMN_059419 [Dreissena polymorpha]
MPSYVEDAASESRTNACITTDLNNTCTLEVFIGCPGIWDILHSQNVKHLRLQGWGYTSVKVDHVPSLSRSQASLTQQETLTMHLSSYIDLQLPPSLKHVNVCYKTLFPSELRHLVNKLCALTQSVECKLEFCCGNKITKGTANNIQPEEYIPIQQELQAREHVEVKRFRIYDLKPNTDRRSVDKWSVRGSVVDDGDNRDDIGENELFKWYIRDFGGDVLNRISMRLQINCVKEQALVK